MIHERARNRHALPLAAGKFIGFVHHAFAELDLLERLASAFAAFFRRRTVVNHGQLDVVERGRARQQIESLKDESDFLVANVGQFVVVEFADEPPGKPVMALRRGVEAAD